MRSVILPACAAAALALAGAPAWGAGITGIKFEPSPAKAGSPTRIVITAEPETSSFCGLRVEYGDGGGDDVKVDDKVGVWPRAISHTYAKPGTYTVSVKGKRVTSHLPCQGEAKASLTVEAGAAQAEAKPESKPEAKAAAAAPACPDGYKMAGKPDKAGAFKCTKAAKDAKLTEIDCGEKLEFYAQGKTIGCRKPAAKK